MVSHRKVGAADRAAEQDVPDDGEAGRRMVEDDVAGRVARAMVHVEAERADRHGVAVHQPAVRFEHLAADAVIAAVILQPRDPEAVRLVRPFDRHAELVAEDLGRAAMVDMAVGEEDLLDLHLVLRRRRLQPVEVAAGIGEGALHRLGAPEEGGVLLERRDGHDDGLEGRLGRCRLGHGGRHGAAFAKLQPAPPAL